MCAPSSPSNRYVQSEKQTSHHLSMNLYADFNPNCQSWECSKFPPTVASDRATECHAATGGKDPTNTDVRQGVSPGEPVLEGSVHLSLWRQVGRGRQVPVCICPSLEECALAPLDCTVWSHSCVYTLDCVLLPADASHDWTGTKCYRLSSGEWERSCPGLGWLRYWLM